jgi:hypothetical protein
MDETAAVFKESGYPDVEDLEKEEIDNLAKQLGADVILSLLLVKPELIYSIFPCECIALYPLTLNR